MNLEKTNALLRRNEQWIPGGLSSLNRRADPCLSFAEGRGGRVRDFDGNEYIDYHLGFAPFILGHNDPEQIRSVQAAFASGLSNFGSGTTSEEGELARLLLECLPHADRVQLLNTGSEATLQALRVARAWTGRSHVVKIQGGYNGHHNMVAANLMSTRAALGDKPRPGGEYPLDPITAGIPPEEAALIHPVEFNDIEAAAGVCRRHPVAALILEPALQNIGVVPPDPGYLEGLRRLADREGFLLIFDEVKTGFRAGLGGMQTAAGVAPDLSTFGKAMANGFPIAALAGKRSYMDLTLSSDPAKKVLLAGTYNAHPAPVAAAIACLKRLMDPAVDAYNRFETLGSRLQAGQERLFRERGIPATVSRIGSASSVYFMDKPPRSWWDILTGHDFELDLKYRRGLIERGVYHFPVPTKQGSLCLAHAEADIDETLERTEEVLRAL